MEELIRVENKIEDSIVQYDIVPFDTDVNMSIDVLQRKVDEINAEIEQSMWKESMSQSLLRRSLIRHSG